jgi:hypothetical protein
MAYNRTGAAATVGMFLLFDDAGASAQSETTFDTGGPLGNVILPTTAGIGADGGDVGYRGCVVVGLGNDAGADNTLIKVCARGYVQVQITAAENVAFGDLLSGANGVATMTETATQFIKVYARAQEEIASAVAGQLYWVHLEGLCGFGRWDT